MNKAFFINGGAGSVLCSIPALERYAETHDDFVIVSESWSELYLNSKVLREKVFPLGHKDLFENYLKDKQIISPEPYRVNQYFNQKCNLIQAFDIIINELDEVRETGKINLELNKEDQVNGHLITKNVRDTKGKEKIIVFQPFGQSAKAEGQFIYDSSGRSFEIAHIIKLIQELNMHSSKVNKWIILHDTETFGEKGENSVYSIREKKEYLGLKFAVNEFLKNNSETWRLHEHYIFCNGLTILKRIKK